MSHDDSDGDTALELNVIDAIVRRRSTRAFLPRPVDEAIIRKVLDVARWTPSQSNIQPWRVDIVSGETLARFKREMTRRYLAGEPLTPEYPQYPSQWQQPYDSRRRHCGMGLYATLGISRDDREERRRAMAANYDCFGAPMACLIWTPRFLGQSFWVDCGMFLNNLLLAAGAHGLASMPQGALADYADLAHDMFNVGDEFLLLCGVSFGYADPEAAINGFKPDRETIDQFTTFWR